MSSATAVVLVCRDPKRARAWRLEIEAEGRYEVVAVASSGVQLRHTIDEVEVDVVVSELHLAEGDAAALVRSLRQGNKSKYADLMILLISPSADDPALVECLRQGADSYYVDSGTPPTLCSRLDEMITGEAKMSPSIAKEVLGHFLSQPYDPSESMGGRPNPEQLLSPFTLSPMERAVLLRLASGQSVPDISRVEQLSMHQVAKCIRGLYRKMAWELRASRFTLV